MHGKETFQDKEAARRQREIYLFRDDVERISETRKLSNEYHKARADSETVNARSKNEIMT